MREVLEPSPLNQVKPSSLGCKVLNLGVYNPQGKILTSSLGPMAVVDL